MPFLDPVVTNFAFALPTRHKVRGLSKKVLLRKAVAPLLPHGRARTQARVSQFRRPRGWGQEAWIPFAHGACPAETLTREGLLPPGGRLPRLIGEHLAGIEDNSRQLWGLLSFTLWYGRHVEQVPPVLHSARMGELVS